ncbi:phosphatidylglycerol/phosphatidylinositol transfer protein-like [Phragmites australis]|uniref:phosphatidylglycerol/phosphatidylinositol transfer protein-like n=1 Tax=Phragmites australis TaxID=29695 RepID=UPI002D77566B|nr:phosphatidylglycerol/phosphatidylinositol transfer protein-like [Phragmites australis]
MASKQGLLLALLAASVAVGCLLPAASAATSVEYCNKGKNYPVKVSGVEIVPDPVVPGQLATFNISAFTDKTIEKGKLVIDVKYWIFHVHSETHDICGETTCPASGKFVLAHQQTLPSFTPPGSYTITMTMLGDNDKELSCISFGFSIGFVASS